MKKTIHRSISAIPSKLILRLETLRIIAGGRTDPAPVPLPKSVPSCNDPLCTIGSVASDCCLPLTRAC